MKKFHKVENENIFKNFCFEREIRPSSIKSYKNALQKYSNFTNMTLDELIQEAETEQAGVILRRRKINTYLRDFELSLKELEYAENSIKLTILLVKAFYRHNDIELPRNKKRSVGNAKRRETINDIPTMEEIRRFMEHCNSVYKAMTIMCLSSGMGAGEVTSLTFKHLYESCSIKTYPETINQLIEQLKAKGDFIPEWDIIRIKRNHPYITFSSPESVKRIIIYLDELHNKFPDYKPKVEDKLFRGLRTNKPLTSNDFSSNYVYINKANSFRKTENNRNVVKTHSLRKFFASTLEAKDVQFLRVRRLLGHNVDSTINAYFKPDPKNLKEDYSRVVQYLMTTEQDVIVLNPLEKLENEVNIIKGLVIKSGNYPEEISDIISRETLIDEIKFEKSMKDNPEYYENEYRKAMNENLI